MRPDISVGMLYRIPKTPLPLTHMYYGVKPGLFGFCGWHWLPSCRKEAYRLETMDCQSLGFSMHWLCFWIAASIAWKKGEQ